MKTTSVRVKTTNDNASIIQIWKDSVRASHHFLSHEDISSFTPAFSQYVEQCTNMWVAVKENLVVGFISIEGKNIQTLFIAPSYFHQGFGRTLLQIAIENNANTVQVYEENQNALRFYQKNGFRIDLRVEHNGDGKPYPMLYLSIPTPKIKCAIFDRCGGCTHYHVEQTEQNQHLLAPVKTWLQIQKIDIQAKIHSFVFWGFRDRCDIQLQNGKFGLFERGTQKIIAIEHCPKINHSLNASLEWLQRNPPPISKASLLLRRASNYTQGLWIDTSHQNIHALLEEKSWLEKAQKRFIIEIGQKNKRIKRKESGWGLHKHPILYPWFETTLSPQKTIPLFCTIRGFTQPSMQSNAVIGNIIYTLLQTIRAKHWLEYGCGSGNFSFMLSQNTELLTLVEPNPTARKGLIRGMKELEHHCPYSFATRPLHTYDYTAALLDPPRNGLGENILSIAEHPTCQHIIYVSCYFQSMKQDMEILLSKGYQISHIEGVAQFPNSLHCEWIVHLTKADTSFL